MKIENRLPNSIEAERAILGAILNEKQAFSIARTFIKSDAFFDHKIKAIYLACDELFINNEPIDLVTVSRALRSKKEGIKNALEMVGGANALVSLSQDVSSSANIEYHCRIVMEMWMRRLLSAVSATNSKRANDQTFDIFEIMSKSLSELSKITEMLNGKKTKSISELAFETITELDMPLSDESSVPTYITVLDNSFKMKSGDLIIIAARPGAGKTSLVVTILVNLGLKQRRGIFFSLEMPSYQIVQKALSCESDVPYWKIRERKCDDFEKDMIKEAYGNIKDIKSMINDSSNLTIEEIKALSIAENSKEPIQFIIIDFLQIIKPSSGGTRDQEIGHITRNAKGIAKELGVPVIMLSQLSREVEKRADKRPQLSDLRDSGNIEQDADTVALMYRAEYYRIDVDEDGNSTKNTCEIDIAKHRHGGTGSVTVGCRMEIGKFYDLGQSSELIKQDLAF
jgi:replicative DNA helicase